METLRVFAGDPKIFAIESELEVPVDAHWVFGQYRFWVYGTEIGNWEDVATVAACVGWLETFFFDENYPRLYGNSSEKSICELFDFYHSRVWDNPITGKIHPSVSYMLECPHLIGTIFCI